MASTVPQTRFAVLRVRRRQQVLTVLAGSSAAFSVAVGVGGVGLLLLRATGHAAAHWLIVGGSLAAASAVVGGLRAARRFWDAGRAARQFDRAAGTNEALSSALALDHRVDAIAELVREAAEQRATANASVIAVPASGWWRWPTVAGCAAGAFVATGLWMPGEFAPASPARVLPEVTAVKADVAAIKQSLAADVANPNGAEERRRLTTEMEKLEAELAAGLRTQDSARAKGAETLAQAAAESERRADETEDEARAVEQALAKAARRASRLGPSRPKASAAGSGPGDSGDAAPLSEDATPGSPVADLLTAFEQGDYAKAAEAAAALENAADDMTPAERAEAAERLREFAESLDDSAELEAATERDAVAAREKGSEPAPGSSDPGRTPAAGDAVDAAQPEETNSAANTPPPEGDQADPSSSPGAQETEPSSDSQEGETKPPADGSGAEGSPDPSPETTGTSDRRDKADGISRSPEREPKPLTAADTMREMAAEARRSADAVGDSPPDKPAADTPDREPDAAREPEATPPNASPGSEPTPPAGQTGAANRRPAEPEPREPQSPDQSSDRPSDEASDLAPDPANAETPTESREDVPSRQPESTNSASPRESPPATSGEQPESPPDAPAPTEAPPPPDPSGPRTDPPQSPPPRGQPQPGQPPQPTQGAKGAQSDPRNREPTPSPDASQPGDDATSKPSREVPTAKSPPPSNDPQGSEQPGSTGGKRTQGLADQIKRVRDQAASGKVDRQNSEKLRRQAEQLMKGMTPEERAELEKAAQEWAAAQNAGGQGDPVGKTGAEDNASDKSGGTRGKSSDRGGNNAGTGRGPVPTPTEVPRSDLAANGETVRPRESKTDPPAGGQTLAEWLSDPSDRSDVGSAATQPSARTISEGADRAIEERRIPKGYDTLVRRVFDRIGERASDRRTRPQPADQLAPAAASPGAKPPPIPASTSTPTPTPNPGPK